MIRNFAVRFGYTPMSEELSAVIGCAPASIEHKLKRCNFKDHEKILIAKEFELNVPVFESWMTIITLTRNNCCKTFSNIIAR